MKAKLLLTLALLAGSASFAQAGVFIGARFGVGYGCYRCGYYPRHRVAVGYAVGYAPAWRRSWYPRYWRAGYWAPVAPAGYAGGYWAAPPPPPFVPIAYAPPVAPAPVPAPVCPTVAPPPPVQCPPVPAAPKKTCVRKHTRPVKHAKKATRPCNSTAS